MAVDPYSPCPCGSGKKLKFCCADLLPDLEKVHRMLEGEQPRAALSHLTQALEKTPGRPCLLDLKATVEMSLGDFDAARATVEEFTRVAPQDPTAHAQAALLAASDAQTSDPDGGATDANHPSRRAVDHLQTALELIDESIPARVLQAIGAVGQALLAAGDFVAARAHLWLYQGVSGPDDSRATELLMRLNQVGGLPLLLRDSLYLREPPAGHPSEAQHDHAQLMASRGQWRRAAELLAQLCEAHPDVALLHHNDAVVAGWLGDAVRFSRGLRRFAELTAAASADGLADDAVEAAAIAELLDPEQRDAPIEVVRTSFPVQDEEKLVDRLTRDPRAAAYPLNESELQAIEGPPPRQTLMLLDRPSPETGVGITADETPRILGFLSYYGRQTDREERLELVADRDEQFNEAIRQTREIGGDALGDPSDEEVVGEAPAGDSALRARWRFPADTPVAHRRELLAAERRRALLEEWPETPKASLGGKTPAEATAEPSQRLALAAAVLVIEQSAGSGVDPGVFEQLRERLGLPSPPGLDPRAVDLETLPLVRIARLDLEAATDEDLATLYQRAEMAGANEAVVTIARVAVERPSFSTLLPLENLYQRLVTLEPDPQAALRWVERARASAELADKSTAPWDLIEIELRVMEGDLDEANRLIQHVRTHSLDEPGVAERLYGLLYALGAIPADGGPMAAAADAGPQVAPAEPGGDAKLWTPGSEEPAPGGGGGQKIWTPS